MPIYIIYPDFPIHLFFSKNITKHFISNKHDIKVLSRQTSTKTIRNKYIQKNIIFETVSLEFNNFLKTSYYTNENGNIKNSFSNMNEIKSFFLTNISNADEIKFLFNNSYEMKYVTNSNPIDEINYILNYEILKNNLNLEKIIDAHKRNIHKNDLINQIEYTQKLELFHYFLINYFQIISIKKIEKEVGISKIEKITYRDIIKIVDKLEKYKTIQEPLRYKKLLKEFNPFEKFNDFEKFKNVINIRINFNEIELNYKQIQDNEQVIGSNYSDFLEDLSEFLYKNAFIELSYSIYSFKFKNYVSYFDLEKLISRLYETDNKVKDTKELEFRFQVRKSFHSKNKVDFSKKILEIEPFINIEDREKILFSIIENCVDFKDGIEQNSKTKILKPLYKGILMNVFHHQNNDNSDNALSKVITKLRRSLKNNPIKYPSNTFFQ